MTNNTAGKSNFSKAVQKQIYVSFGRKPVQRQFDFS